MSIAVYTSLLEATERADNARNFGQYGGNPELVKLRCFKYYHPDQGSFITTPEGRERWLGPKASRVYAILDRSSSSTSRLTMKDIASEAMASISTVSRTVQKLQAYGLFAIDVIRGRHGGIYVRRRRPGDHLRHYAAAAWKRIRNAAERAISRTKLKVASDSSLEEGEGSWVPVPTVVVMDATFIGEDDDPLQAVRHLHPNDPFRRAVVKQLTEQKRVEHAGRMVGQGEWSIDYAQAWFDGPTH